jgi:D-arabinose 1-dehydrogenase-like Zn-dependent alcohol dehydrogenase
VFFLQLRILGSTMGTRDELAQLARLCEDTGIRPEIDRVLPLSEVREGFAAMATGDVFGKIVFVPV